MKRWIKVGWERKKGGGRKTKDPEMEKRLYQWYVEMKDQSNPVTAKMIKDMAIKLSSCGDFIASKGWLDKFKIRYRLEISKEAVNLNGQVIDIQGMRDGNSHNSLQLSNLDSQIHIDWCKEEVSLMKIMVEDSLNNVLLTFLNTNFNSIFN